MQELDIYNSSYIIIGGPNSKKSFVSSELSKRLNLKLINLDREKHSYFDDFTDYDFEYYQNLLENKGIITATKYINKYEMQHLKYVLNNIKESVVIDFGSTYTLINDESILNTLKLFKNIIFLDVSRDIKDKSNKFNKTLYNNRINYDLATCCINIENKKVNEIVNEILNINKFKDIL